MTDHVPTGLSSGRPTGIGGPLRRPLEENMSTACIWVPGGGATDAGSPAIKVTVTFQVPASELLLSASFTVCADAIAGKARKATPSRAISMLLRMKKRGKIRIVHLSIVGRVSKRIDIAREL